MEHTHSSPEYSITILFSDSSTEERISYHRQTVVDEMHRVTAPFQKDKLLYIKNPVIAEFLNLQTSFDFTETKLENSIIGHLQNFIMEMGKVPSWRVSSILEQIWEIITSIWFFITIF